MKPKPIDEHRTKSLLRRALSGWAGRLGFAYYDMLYSQSDMDRPGQPTRSSAKVKANPAEAGDLEIVTARLSEDSKYWFDQSLKAGSVCYVGRHEGQIMGYVFADHRAVLMLGKELKKLPEGFVFIYNSYIFPEFRGRGLYTVFLTEFRADLRSQGNRYIASLVDRENAASIGPGLHFGTLRERAPILCVPGFKPIVLGRGFRMMSEVVKERSKG